MDGHVYAIRCTHTQRIKIGWTKHETGERRRQTMQGGSPTVLELLGQMPGTVADEQAMLRLLHRYRLHGEWFKACDEVHDVANVVAGGEPTMEIGQIAWSHTGWWRGSKRRRGTTKQVSV
jgi:hypothetical protein